MNGKMWLIAKRGSDLEAVRRRDLNENDKIAVSPDGACRARVFKTAREAKAYMAQMDN